MTEWDVFLVMCVYVVAAGFAGYMIGRERSRKKEYERGYVAARIKYEIPRDEHGKFVKRQP